MKPQLEHPMTAHRQKKIEEAPELPIHTIMPPEDEMFLRHMQQSEALFNAVPTKNIQSDDILDREMNKRDIFNKLVLLKEDHCTEVQVAGLSWKMKLLNSIDNAFIMKEVRKEPGDDQLGVLPLLILAAAIVEVNGIKFEEFYTGPSTVEEPILKRYYELRQWQRPIINVLQKTYTDFQLKTEKDYTKDFLVK